YSVPSDAAMKPNPLFVSRLIVPFIVAMVASLKSGQSTAGSSDAGIAKSGIGFPINNRRHAWPIQRAHRADRCTRALSVAIPVFAYIWRYSFEINTKARRARTLSTTRERAQT